MTGLVPWRAYAFLISGMATVGAYIGFSKVLVATVPVFILGAIRFGIAALLMLPWTFPAGSRAVLRQQGKVLVVQSFFGNFLFTLCALSGIARTSATSAGLIMSTLPAAVALLSFLALREALGWRTGAAIALAVAGVAVLNLPGAGPVDAPVGWLGNLLVVAAVFCEAIYVVLGKRLLNAAVTPLQNSAWINLVGLALILPLGIHQALGFDFAGVEPHVWLSIVAYSVAASVVSPWLWLSGLQSVPANQAGVFTIALPLSSAIVGVVFLSESLGVAQLITFACALAGLILVSHEARNA